jgi:hypothetical protein
MIVRPWVLFRSALPRDGVEGEHDWIEWPGRGVATIIAEMLRRLGCEVEEPEHAHEHGWQFDAVFQRRRFFCQVTDIEEIYLLVQNPIWLERVRGKHPQAYVDLLRGLARELEADPRFSELRWFTQRELDSHASGAPSPVETGKEARPPARS